MRKVAPRTRKVAPRMRKAAPRMRKVVPHMHKAAPRMRKVVPHMRKAAPHLRIVVPRMRKAVLQEPRTKGTKGGDRMLTTPLMGFTAETPPRFSAHRAPGDARAAGCWATHRRAALSPSLRKRLA
jgi:hypothetical protein